MTRDQDEEDYDSDRGSPERIVAAYHVDGGDREPPSPRGAHAPPHDADRLRGAGGGEAQAAVRHGVRDSQRRGGGALLAGGRRLAGRRAGEVATLAWWSEVEPRQLGQERVDERGERRARAARAQTTAAPSQPSACAQR